MSNKLISYLSPDKIIKDFLWDDLVEASKYANGSLIDIGCGKKPYKPIFEGKVSMHIGIDKYSPEADIKRDFLNSHFPKNSYDTALCTQVLEHTPEPMLFLKKINSLLKKKGILILTVPFTGSLHEIPDDYYRYTIYSLRYLLKKTNFEIIYIKEQGNWPLSISQDIIFYLESTLNRYFLRYPKKIIQLLIQIIGRLISRLPTRFTKPEMSPINYIIVARKKLNL